MLRILSLFIAIAAFLSVHAAEEADGAKWLTDYQVAVAEATKAKKPLLLVFSGSDWCPPCKMLKKKVFDSAEFKTWAGEHVVLVELDFPKKKKQSAEVKKQNEVLRQKHNIEGYPTAKFLDPTGEKTLGEMVGGASDAKKWIEEATTIISAK